MATWNIISIVALFAALTLTVATELEGLQERDKCPPGNPLCHIWQPCEYSGEVEVSCQNCNTRIICTPLGGLVSPCLLPGLRNCVDGACVRQPSDACAPGTPEPEPEYTSTLSMGME